MQRVHRETFAWILAALLGLAVAAGVMAAASHLSSQRVGLASEPPSAGARLAPAGEPAPSPPTRRARRPARQCPAQGHDDHDAEHARTAAR